jgi:hypothetical protein
MLTNADKQYVLNGVLCAVASVVVFAAPNFTLQAQSFVSTESPQAQSQTQAALERQSSLPAEHDNAFSSSASLPSAPDRASGGGYTDGGNNGIQPSVQDGSNATNFADRWHNADGSRKLAFNVGGGMTIPAGNSRDVFTLNYGLEGGVGYNFNRKFGVLAELGYDRMGFRARSSQFSRRTTTA